MRAHRVLGARLACATAALALVACLGKPTPQTFYTLSATPHPESDGIASLPDLGLAIGPIDFPRYLDRPEVVSREGAHAVALSNRHRWAGSLRNDFQLVLTDEIGRLLGTAHVVAFPNVARFRVDQRIAVELVAFDGALGQPVVLRARWTIASGKDERALAVEVTEIAEAPADASWDALVAAHARAVHALARDIATRSAALASPRRGT
jgi:hypothetical protein